jgi:hypothetical protein
MGPLGGPTPLQHPGFIDARTAGKLLMCKDSWFTGNVTIFRREPLVAIGGFPEDLDSMTDGYVSRRLAVCYGCAFTPEVLGAWRRMESGLAWSQTVDFHYATRIAERVERRMREETEKFPAGYPERWKRRYLFGARRFALATSRRKARSKGIGHYLPALVREIFGTLWLFAIMRPFDIFAMMCRYLRFARVPVNKD